MNIENARNYYGQVLQGSSDLLTDACSVAEAPGPALRAALANVHPDVRARYYGCGFIAPAGIEGAHVLDLGCGAGQDTYVLAQFVGPEGRVTGVDATPEQLAVARATEGWHAERFGHGASNVRFLDGDIEALDSLDLPPESFDVIVSNCVINLVADKGAVFRAAHRLLKPGGEMYFADVYADRRVPEALKSDPVLHGECLSGALYWNDFLSLAKAAGFDDPRLITDRPLGIGDDRAKALLDGINFFSATWRLFKLAGLEPECEDYGQAVIYKGTLPGHERRFMLDKHHVLETGRVFPICGNSWRMLADTRFAPHFDFIGDFSRHFGIFPGCGTTIPFAAAGDTPVPASCC
jgi:SAM-dependent methyltransferase